MLNAPIMGALKAANNTSLARPGATTCKPYFFQQGNYTISLFSAIFRNLRVFDSPNISD